MIAKIVSLVLLGLVLVLPAYGDDSLNVTQLGEYNFWSSVQEIAVAGDHAYVAEVSSLRVLDISDMAAPREIAYCQSSGSAVHVNQAGTLVYLGGNGLDILDVSNPTEPTLIGHCTLTIGNAAGLEVAFPYAYAVGGWSHSGLSVINISNPEVPVEVGWCTLPSYSRSVAVAGNYAYVADGSAGMRVVDISNPSIPTVVGVYHAQNSALDVAVSGNYAYLLDPGCPDAGLKVLDISNPTTPVLSGAVGCYEDGCEVEVAGSYVLLTVRGRGLRFIDVSNPSSPVEALIYLRGEGATLTLTGSYAYLGDDGSISIHDISNPLSPLPVGSFDVFSEGAHHVVVQGSYAYLSMKYYGLQIMDIADPAMPLLKSIFYSSGDAENLALVYPYVYLADGSAGLRVLDVSNPTAVIEVGHCNLPGNAEGVAMSGGYAYLACSSGDLRVVNITNPAMPVEVGHCLLPGNPRSVAISGNYAYVGSEYSSYGMHIVNISNPTAPTLVSSYPYSDDTEEIIVSGSYAYVANWNNGLRIINVSNPAQPVQVCQIDPSGWITGLDIIGPLLFVAGDLIGLRVYNVSTPSAPVEVGHYSGVGNFDDVAVMDSIAYGTQYMRFGIYDVSDCNPLTAVTMLPVSLPIQIPALGGSFQYTINLANLSPVPQTFDLWNMVRLPNQNWYGPIVGPLALTLPGSTTLSRLRTQTVPGSAPSGYYRYEARLGNYPDAWCYNNFTFRKMTTLDGQEITGWDNTGEPFSGEEAISHQPSAISLLVASPNPFNPTTAISYQLSANSHVSLKVFDTAGKLVATLVEGWRQAGEHQVTFDGTKLASGIYLVKLSTGDFSKVQKIVLMK